MVVRKKSDDDGEKREGNKKQKLTGAKLFCSEYQKHFYHTGAFSISHYPHDTTIGCIEK